MVGLLLSAGIAIAVTYGGLADWLSNPDNHLSYSHVVAGSSIAILTFFAFHVSHSFNYLAARSAQAKPVEGLPWGSSIFFGLVVSLMHFGAWVPVAFGTAMMIPLFFLPPLMYRVMSPEQTTKPKLFTMEETCKTQDVVYMSKMIKDFRERYPNSKAYMYKSNQNHTAGGIILHSKEKVPEIDDTFIEVTLNCPFTTKSGVFAEGKEIFFAYLGRHVESGSIVSPLPQKHWQTWLEGLTDSEWYDRISALDRMETTHPYLEDYPCQFTDLNIKWEPFTFT